VRNRFRQKGLREKLLCQEDETRLSRWEYYSKKALFGGTELFVSQDGPFLRVSGLDAKSFRLFQLSILWRASVSRLPFYKNVSLGPHEELIRKQLLVDDPADYDAYPCLMFALVADGEPLTDFIYNPERLRFKGCNGYRFVFGSHIWFFVVSKQRLPEEWQQFYLSQEGSCLILMKDAQDIRFLRQFAIELKSGGKLPE